MDAQFLDDRRLIAVSGTESGAAVALYALSDVHEPIWRRTLATRAASRLLVDQRSGRWRVVGYTKKAAIRIDGDANGEVTEHTWPVSPSDARRWIVGNGGDLIGLKSRATYGWSQRFQLLYTRDLHIPLYPQSIGVMDGHGFRTIADSDQDVRCQSPVPDRAMFCIASDGGTTSVWRVDGDALLPVGTMTGEIVMMDTTPGGELVAWRGTERLLIDGERRALSVMPKIPGQDPVLVGVDGRRVDHRRARQ